MGSRTKIALIGALAAFLPAGAMAADFYYPPPVNYPPPVEIASNWYIRGDIGWKAYTAPTALFNAPLFGYDVPGAGELIDESLGNTGIIGFGFGYRYSPSFRADLTLDYEWNAPFRGRLECLAPCTPDPDPEYSVETANISALTLLANAYWDIGKWGSLTPYIGAGVGVARLTTSSVAFTNPDTTTGTWPGASTWNFAWALMLGAAYDISPNTAIDFNYRYAHLGNAVSGPTSLNSIPIQYNNINAHEFRVGFRYSIW